LEQTRRKKWWNSHKPCPFHQPFLHLSLHGWWPRVTCWQRSPKVIEIHDLGTLPWQGFKALDPFRFHLTSKYWNKHKSP
jgi:hypothetical protein